MTRRECLKRLENGDKELHHIYWTNYWKTKKFFKPLIDDMKKERPGINIVLHHIELNDQNYELWDTIVPMYTDEHTQLHGIGRMHTEEAKQKMRKPKSEETRQNMSKARMGIEPWNKNLTKETSESVKNIGEKNSKNLKGKKQSTETIRKRINSCKERWKLIPRKKSTVSWNRGLTGLQNHSEETRKRIGESKIGNKNVAGRYWFNNGEKSVMSLECPEGYKPGRIKWAA